MFPHKLCPHRLPASSMSTEVCVFFPSGNLNLLSSPPVPLSSSSSLTSAHIPPQTLPSLPSLHLSLSTPIFHICTSSFLKWAPSLLLTHPPLISRCQSSCISNLSCLPCFTSHLSLVTSLSWAPNLNFQLSPLPVSDLSPSFIHYLFIYSCNTYLLSISVRQHAKH